MAGAALKPVDEDFLSRTTGAAQSEADADAAFLARTAGPEPAPPPPEEPDYATDKIQQEGADRLTGQLQSAWGRLSGTDRPTVDTGDTIAPGLRNALAPAPNTTYGQVLPIARDQATGALRIALPSAIRGLANGGLDLLEGPTTGTVTPGATNALAFAAMGGKLTPSVARGTGAAIADSMELGAPKADLYAKNQPAVAQPNTLDPNYQPSQPSAAPAPQSVGAAASTASDSNMTPKEIQAYRSTADGQKLLEPQPVGVQDNNLYVKDSVPTNAQIEQSVNTSRELKSLNVTAPGVSAEAKVIAAAANDARQQHFAGLAKSPVDIMNAEAARSAQAEADLQTAFGNKQPTDAQPVADTIEGILSGPRGSENTALQQYVKPLLDRLKASDGTLKTDPEQLYGLREDISRMQSKAARAETPTLDHVTGQLGDIKTALDAAIEKGAPGYQQYLKNYADASRPIDTMQALQAHEPKLYDAQNRMTYSKVQTMMRQIVDSRGAPGLNPYKSIPDDMMLQLWNLRDDLRRSASEQELSRTAGSDTAQNAWDTAKDLGKLGATGVAHSVANYMSPGFGSMGLSIAKNALAPVFSARAGRQRTARGMAILRADPSQLRNPLDQP